MRRTDKQIQSQEEISQLIRQCSVCRLGMAKDNIPYIVPVCFGYDGEAIYFHTANVGMKLDFIRANKQVCFEFEYGIEVIAHEEKPCNWSFAFQTVVGFGKAEELQSEEEKKKGLNHIMAQYSFRNWDLSGIPLTNVAVWKIKIDSMTGKQSAKHVD